MPRQVLAQDLSPNPWRGACLGRFWHRIWAAHWPQIDRPRAGSATVKRASTPPCALCKDKYVHLLKQLQISWPLCVLACSQSKDMHACGGQVSTICAWMKNNALATNRFCAATVLVQAMHTFCQRPQRGRHKRNNGGRCECMPNPHRPASGPARCGNWQQTASHLLVNEHRRALQHVLPGQVHGHVAALLLHPQPRAAPSSCQGPRVQGRASF